MFLSHVSVQLFMLASYQDMVQCILVSGTTLFSDMLMLLSGRPVMIKDEDFETPLPNVDPVRYQQDVFQSVLPSHHYF